jgi:hypothetical protein
VEIEIIEKKISVRGLTRGEIRKLIADGIMPDEVQQIADADEQSAAIDKVLAVVVPGYDPDDVTPAQQYDLLLKILELTYLGTGALKKFATLQKIGSLVSSDSATSVEPKDLTNTGDARKAVLN